MLPARLFVPPSPAVLFLYFLVKGNEAIRPKSLGETIRSEELVGFCNGDQAPESVHV